MSGPLEGLRVIDVCRTRPGQLATALLADYGADVISVVEPGYGERRLQHGAASSEGVLVNRRNKRSMFLNLKQAAAREVLLALVKISDGFLESNRPGVMERLGFGYDALQALNHALVYCSLSGFGQYGPYAGIGAHDVSYQGVAGMIPQDYQTKRPYVPPYNQADLNAASFGAMAITMAFYERSRSGKGQFIDVAFCDVSVSIPPGGQEDEMLRGAYPAYNVFETQDGEYLTLSNREGWFWDRLCALIGRPDWAGEMRPQGALREEMFDVFGAFFKSKPLAELVPLLREADVQFGPVNRTVEQLRADPHLQAREMVLELDNPVIGRQYQPGFAFKYSRTKASLRRGPTLFGTDTEDILKELGYNAEAITALREGRAI